MARPTYAAVVAALVAEGTEVVFGLMGDANMALCVELDRVGIRLVSVRHEATAVLAADGYSRATGRPGVATVTMGPGLANTATALTVARHAAAPVLLLAGAPRSSDVDNVQRFDHSGFALATAGAYADVSVPATAQRHLRDAFLRARTGSGPTVVSLPVDVQDGDGPDDDYVPSTVHLPSPQVRAPEAAALHRLAEMLDAAKRPVLVAGRGALAAAPQIEAVAQRCGALVATTLPAKGLFKDGPRCAGVIGGVALPRTRELLAQADLVVGVGAGLNRFTLDAGRLAGTAALALVTDRVRVAGRAMPLDLVVLADATCALEQLLPLLSGGEGWPQGPYLAAAPDVRYESDPDGMDPREVLDVCNRHLPRERSTVIGIGHFGGWPAQYLEVPVPGALHLPWEFGSIGVGLPYALGVSVGRPDLTTIVFEGDGSLLTNVGELDTLARERVRVVAVVLDDGAYGAEIRKMDLAGMPSALASFGRRDLAATARSLGCPAWTATSGPELATALDEAARHDGPAVVHVPVSRRVTQAVF